MRHLNNGTDHRHSKSCCDQSSPARRTKRWLVTSLTRYCLYFIRPQMEISICDVLSGFWQNCIGRILGVRTCANACVRANTCVRMSAWKYTVRRLHEYSGAYGCSLRQPVWIQLHSCVFYQCCSHILGYDHMNQWVNYMRTRIVTGLAVVENRYVNYMRTRIVTGMVVVRNITRGSWHYGFYSQISWKSHIGVSVIIS